MPRPIFLPTDGWSGGCPANPAAGREGTGDAGLNRWREREVPRPGRPMTEASIAQLTHASLVYIDIVLNQVVTTGHPAARKRARWQTREEAHGRQSFWPLDRAGRGDAMRDVLTRALSMQVGSAL